MSATDRKIAELRSLFPLREEDVERFDRLVFEIADLRDPAMVGHFFSLAEDHCKVGGVVRSMLQSLGVLPADVYVAAFVKAFPEFARRSPYWSADELRRLLWSPEKVAALKRAASNLTPEQASSLRTVLGRIDQPDTPKTALLEFLDD